ncbi:MAG: preprotein translocase subunit SecE [Oscillospiraceae bacterium]|nr:preprotein translocase subunit SecE [Oscillospiraceae bacterium]
MADNEKLEQANAAESAAPAKKEKSDKKPEKKSKPGLFTRIKQWCKETKAELKKVQWPTWKQTVNNTLIVLAFCVVVGLCIFLFDKLAGGLLSALTNLFKG